MGHHTTYKETTIYPDNVLDSQQNRCDVIDADELQSIPNLFVERVSRSADNTAYVQYEAGQNRWHRYSWNEVSKRVRRVRMALAKESLSLGDRVAIRLKNCMQWIMFDQGILAQGLVVVPVYVEDRADNIAYILNHTETKILVLETFDQWQELSKEEASLGQLQRVIIIDPTGMDANNSDSRIATLEQWLGHADEDEITLQDPSLTPDSLATIVYTSGTTGKPKGVMLSHGNMLQNAHAGLKSIAVYPQDRFLSFLPLSHMFERTVGYYLTMMSGAEVAFNRSIPELMDDLAEIQPIRIDYGSTNL